MGVGLGAVVDDSPGDAPGDAFGHQLYPVIFPKVLMHNSKWYHFKKPFGR